MQTIFIIFKWILAFSLLIILLVFAHQQQALQKISLHNIIMEEPNRDIINKQIILSYLEENSVDFDNYLSVDFSKSKLENLLCAHPGIKNAEVFEDQQGAIDILIEQKKAIVRIKNNYADYYLDESGKRMELFDHYIPNLILATGDISNKDHAGIYEFVTEINKSDFWSAQIPQIHFQDNDIFLVPRLGNQKINIGDFENISEKLDHLYQFYKIVMPIKGWKNYSEINLKFKNQIVCLRTQKE